MAFRLMKLIVGLGNPGEKYEYTRHNVGFMVLEHLLKDVEPVEKTVWDNSKKLKSDIAELSWKNHKKEESRVILAKPKTFMNNSGMAVKLLVGFYKVELSDLWIIHDDIDLNLGGLRIRTGGASGGHHGIESIIKEFGTPDFVRFRVGIGRPFKGKDPRHIGRRDKEKVDEYVVSAYDESEAHDYREMVKKTCKALKEALSYDLTRAMNRYNTK